MKKKKNSNQNSIVIIQGNGNGYTSSLSSSPVSISNGNIIVIGSSRENNIVTNTIKNGEKNKNNEIFIQDVKNPYSPEGEIIKVIFFADNESYYEVFRKMFKNEWKYGFPGTYDMFWRNYKFHALNEHPVLSVFFLDDCHPESKAKRGLALFCSSAFGYFVTNIFEYTYHSKDQNFRIREYPSNWIIISIYVFIITYPYDIMIKCLEKQNGRKGCGLVANCCASSCLVILGFLGIAFYTAGFLLTSYTKEDETWSTWLLATGQGYIFWFLFDFPFYQCKYNKTKEEFKSKYKNAVCFDYIGNPKSKIPFQINSSNLFTLSNVNQNGTQALTDLIPTMNTYNHQMVQSNNISHPPHYSSQPISSPSMQISSQYPFPPPLPSPLPSSSPSSSPPPLLFPPSYPHPHSIELVQYNQRDNTQLSSPQSSPTHHSSNIHYV